MAEKEKTPSLSSGVCSQNRIGSIETHFSQNTVSSRIISTPSADSGKTTKPAAEKVRGPKYNVRLLSVTTRSQKSRQNDHTTQSRTSTLPSSTSGHGIISTPSTEEVSTPEVSLALVPIGRQRRSQSNDEEWSPKSTDPSPTTFSTATPMSGFSENSNNKGNKPESISTTHSIIPVHSKSRKVLKFSDESSKATTDEPKPSNDNNLTKIEEGNELNQSSNSPILPKDNMDKSTPVVSKVNKITPNKERSITDDKKEDQSKGSTVLTEPETILLTETTPSPPKEITTSKKVLDNAPMPPI